MDNLQQIFDKYNCDKGSARHRYDRVYEPALNHLRNKKFSMLEIGIFKGSGLKAWLDFFPIVDLVGIDIFTRVKAKNIPVLNDSRVSWFECDSIEGVPLEFVEENKKFDVIIDDGLHSHYAQRKTFENFIPFLKDDGVYFIEDVWPFDRMTAKQKQSNWILKHPDWFSDNDYKDLLNAVSTYNTVFHDIRAGHSSDTFIIEVRK